MEKRRMQRDRRRKNRRQEDRVAIYMTNQMPLRRIPGTLALGITNIIAGLFAFNLNSFTDTFVSAYLTQIFPIGVWGVVFLASGFTLVGSTIYRRWWLFNIGAGMSLFLWAAVSFSIFASWFSGRTLLSPIALAMAFWMLVGQMTMLIVPLYRKWEDLE